MKGCAHDNAVAEATFKLFKIEFANNYHFRDLEQLKIMLADYVNWFNNIRVHSPLDYLTPREYRLQYLEKVVYFTVTDSVFCYLCGRMMLCG